MNTQLIEHYESGGEKLALAIRGLTREDLLCIPPADANVGRWSIQQLVIHCMDSDLVSTDCLKRMIAEDNPPLLGYDENKFAANLFYDDQPAEEAAALVDASRKLFAKVLRKLPEGAWSCKGTHNERGEVTVGAYLKSTVDHLEHHLKFIHAKRAHWGKEMW
ncbi:MAG TPA: DinB family protein [Tepidisphaeraceae bacterium]|nr:DinB family protein [Tepidisphaeraceae bacterium]